MFGIIIIFIVISNCVLVITSSAQPCSNYTQKGFSNCKDSVAITYPFWYSDLFNISNYCGYPGYGVKCGEDGTTVINISNQLFHADIIDSAGKYLRVKEMGIDRHKCPHLRRNFSTHEFGSSLNRNQFWTVFYNCSIPPGYDNKSLEKFHVTCLDYSGRRSYAFPNEYLVPKGFILYANCEETLLVPTNTGAGPASSNFSYEATKGYYLNWLTPANDDCMICESSGGLCSYNIKGGFRKCACGYDFSKEFDKTCHPPPKGHPPKGKSVGISPDVAPSIQPTHKWNDHQGGVSPSNQFTFKPNHRERGISPSLSNQPTITNTASELNSRQIGKSSGEKNKVLMGVLLGGGAVLVVVLIIYCRRILFFINNIFTSHWRNNTKSQTNVEMFLESCEHLTVQRYKYSDIKKMTHSFNETLGGGGYGSVFKGKFKHDGRLVAVKLLKETKGDGEDFINEVATIGRTNHVNVVSLLGFCTEGTKRALVYEFMPNGSLEKFIYKEKTSTTPLGWEKLYQIALGIARGLEYLHRGCNTRILHFDIKPHNILLDQDFCPKISDFGMAKLCPTRESVVSMLVARGTIGYIAPEVYCRNFGGVSHKSDVYSYRMMVLEMIGGRQNIDATVENISEIYFPQWIYNHLNQGVNLEVSEEIFDDETTRKMILVALWCIQRQPADRPSISKVVEMLEGRTEELQMPPNPFEDFPSNSS